MTNRRNWSRGRTDGRCRMCLMRKSAHGHHVVSAQELKRRGLPLYDRRNRFEICQPCHFNHENGSSRIPLLMLRDEHLDYAFDVLGAYGYDYLRRHYRGDDDRLDERLQAMEEAT